MELAIAGAASLIALAALGWQAYEWKRGGARPEVDALVFQSPMDAPVLRIEVRNRGRSACQLVNLLLMEKPARGRPQTGFDPSQYLLDTARALPQQLEAGASCVLDYRASAISRALAHHGDVLWTCEVEAAFGDGTTSRSRGPLLLGEHLAVEDEFEVDHGKGPYRVSVMSSTSPSRGKQSRVLRLLNLK